MKNFFKAVGASIYSKDGYLNRFLETESMGKAFRYFFLLVAILSVLTTITWSFKIVPILQDFTAQSLQSIRGQFPKELEIRIQNGIAATNVREPYAIPLPPKNEDSNSKRPSAANILVTNTRLSMADFSLRRFDDYRTYFLLLKDAVIYKGTNGRITIEPLYKIPNVTVNNQNVDRWLNNLDPFISFATPLAVILILIVWFILYSLFLAYILIAALFIMAVVRLRGVRIKYGQAYKIGLHAITLPLLLQFAFLQLAGLPFGFFIFSLAFVAIALANL